MKHIAFSLFGKSKEMNDSLPVDTFLQNLIYNIKAYKLLLPDWIVILYVEREIYNQNREYLETLKSKRLLKLNIIKDSGDLCENMLWRMYSVHTADYTICRDLDSFPSVREVNAVKHWLQTGCEFHAISDNKEHNQPLMGGMIGYKKDSFLLSEFLKKVKNQKLKSLDSIFAQKGEDQFFLKDTFYGNVSIAEHRITGLDLEKIRKFILKGYDNYFFYDYIPEYDSVLTKEEEHILNKHYIGKPIQDYSLDERNEIREFLDKKIII